MHLWWIKLIHCPNPLYILCLMIEYYSNPMQLLENPSSHIHSLHNLFVWLIFSSLHSFQLFICSMLPFLEWKLENSLACG